MTDIIVINDTHRRHAPLAALIEGAVRRVAPGVADATALTLPNPIRVRLTSPAGIGRAFAESTRQQIHTLTPQSDQDRTALKAMSAFTPRSAYLFARLTWPCVAGAVVMAADGTPEVVTTPGAFQHLRLNQRTLEAVLAHELDHLAVFHSHPAMRSLRMEAVWASNSPGKKDDAETKAPGLDPDMITYYLEGRAVWVQRHVTQGLHGDPMDFMHDGSKQDTSLRVRLTNRIFSRLKMGEHYKQGADFIAHIHREGGIVALNAALEDVDLIPPRAEAAQPDQWIERFLPQD